MWALEMLQVSRVPVVFSLSAFSPTNSSAGGVDYSVVTGAQSLKNLTHESPRATHAITIPKDMVAFETVETVTLTLQQTVGHPVSLLLNSTVIIIDTERSELV